MIPDRTAPNASWDATLQAAAEHGLRVEWGWFPPFGVGVLDIGDRNPPAGFSGLYLWNGSSGAWETASVGISFLVLKTGDAIAWDNAAFGDPSFIPRSPVATPAYPYPAVDFRGDGRNSGVSASQAPNGPGVLWIRNLTARNIGSTPAVALGSIFVNTNEGLFALDDYTGATRWVNRLVHGYSSPAVFDLTLILGGSDGRVYRVDAMTGRERWNTSLLAIRTFTGITSSPRVAFDRVYLGTFNETGGPGEVVALWVSNGTVAWRHATGSVHFSSPAIANGTVYVGIMGRYNVTLGIAFDPPYGVLALDEATGAERWFFPTGGSVASSPVVSGDLVIAPAKDGWVYAIDRTLGTQRWRAFVHGAGVSSPALVGSTLYVGGGAWPVEGRISALDVNAGTERWSVTVPGGPFQASISYADGKLVSATNANQGTVYALNQTSGAVVWEYRPQPDAFILGSPVVSNATVYGVSDNGQVYAIRDPLALVTVQATEEAHPPEEARVVISATASARVRGAVLRVTLPGTLQATGSTVPTTRHIGNILEWDLGEMDPSESFHTVVLLRTASEYADWITAQVQAEVTYTDVDGAAYPPATAVATVRVQGPYNPTFVALVVAVPLAVVASLVVIVFWLWRRRRAHP